MGTRANSRQLPPIAPEAPGLLSALSRGVQASGLYAPDHPSIARAAREAAALAKPLLARRPTLSIGITPEAAIIDAREVQGAGSCEPLTNQLHHIDVASIELKRGVTPADLVRFCVLVYRVRRERLGAAELAKALKTATKGRISCTPIGYGALTVTSGVRIESKSTVHVGWNEIVGGLMSGAGADPHVVAGIVEARFHNTDLTGENLCPLREELLRLLNEDSSAAEKRRDTLEKVQTFVEALSPTVREALLRVDLPSPEASIRLLFELIDVLPTSEVIKALESVDHSSKSLSKDALRLFHKLANISEQAPDHRARVADVFGEWAGQQQGGHSITKDLEGSLEEIFRRYDQKEYNPEQYDADLDRLSRKGAADTKRRRLGESDDLQTRAIEIAVEVCTGVIEGDCDGALETILVGADRLLTLGRFDLLSKARFAAEQNLQRPGCDLTKAAARAYLAHIAHEGFIEQVLDICCRCPVMPAGAGDLLRAGRVAAIGPIFARLGGPLAEAVRNALEEIIAECGARELRLAIDQINRPDAISAIEPLLIITCNRCGADIIEPLLTRPDPDTRRRAFQIVAKLDRPWPIKALRLALCDSDDEILASAIDAAAGRAEADPEALEALADLAEGRLAGGSPPDEHMRRAVDALTETPAGVARIAAGLRARSLAFRPAPARSAKHLAKALQPRAAEHPELRRALMRWRLSPAFAISLIDRRADQSRRAA